MVPTNDTKRPSLEDHIGILRGLDELRRTSARLRDDGVATITQWITGYLTNLSQAQEPSKDSKELADDDLRFIPVVIDILYRFSTPIPTNLKQLLDDFVHYLERDRSHSGTPSTHAAQPPTPHAFLLANLSSIPLSMLLAAELMQTLAAAPDRAYSKHNLLCYYWILRELYTADAPDWSIGGARAGANGTVSAFVTHKCVLSIARFAHAQEYTAHFIECLCSFEERRRRLEQLPHLPRTYKQAEEQRLRFSCYVELQRYGKTLALPLDVPTSPLTIDEHVKHIIDNIAETVECVSNAFKDATTEIVEFRTQEENSLHDAPFTVDLKASKRRFERSKFGHDRALLAIERGHIKTNEIKTEISKNRQSDKLEILKVISSKLKEAAQGVRRMLEPSQRCLSAVLDRELAATCLGSNNPWEPQEMAFAAASLGILDKRWREDERLDHALAHLSSTMSNRGHFPYSRPFHVNEEEPEFVYGCSVLRIIAELARCAGHTSVDLFTVRKMLKYFSDTQSTNGRGWVYEDATRRDQLMVGPTIASVRALAAINRMLDGIINRTILQHFRVRLPDRDLELDLDALFYPDYGLNLIPNAPPMPTDRKVSGPGALFDETEWPKTLRPEESIAITLQRMRAHVIRAPIPRAAGERPCSLVLHGPPGTGKTSLVEALAKSCGVPFVEVTPSDIVVGGEEEVERRTTTVFEALTLLTRVVILFDEFDPVLWRRDPTGSTPRSVFTFLTPGMLPKLKDLHRWAKKRCYAYVLVTNLIGGLDDAAVRDGRFDKKIGLYPPDPISRIGHFLVEAQKFHERRDVAATMPDDYGERVLEICKKTAGGAMEMLGSRGWMTSPVTGDLDEIRDMLDSNNRSVPFAYAFINDISGVQEVSREAHLKGPNGYGKLAIAEFMQWWWIDRWDMAVREATNLGNVEDAYLKDDHDFRDFKDLMDHLVDWKKTS